MRENIVSIQFLRFIAAALVALFHSTVAIQKYFGSSVSSSLMAAAGFGASGVHIFFVISGFIMVYTSFENKTDNFLPSRFAIKRIVRIYPIYFVYSAFYLYFYYLCAGGKNLSVEQFFGAILLFPGYSSYIIGPGWTLSYEVYFYLCFTLAMIVGLRKGILSLAFFFVLSILIGFALDTKQPVIHVLTDSLLIEFLFGAGIGYAVVSSVQIGNRLANLMLALALLGFSAGITFGYTRWPSALTWGVPSALLLAGIVFREKNGSIPFLIKKYSFLGDSSYSLYLLHIMLIDAVILLAISLDDSIRMHVLLIGNSGIIIVCLVITAFCIAVAYIAYELIERRLVRWLQELYRRKFAAVPASLR